jgi:hypothetical protein
MNTTRLTLVEMHPYYHAARISLDVGGTLVDLILQERIFDNEYPGDDDDRREKRKEAKEEAKKAAFSNLQLARQLFLLIGKDIPGEGGENGTTSNHFSARENEGLAIKLILGLAKRSEG